jgi:penicillin-binding protein 2
MKDTARVRVDVRARRLGSFRLSVLVLAVIILAALVGLRFFELQVVQGRENREKSRLNSLRDIPIRPIRSEIVDRNGTPLAVDVPQYKLFKIKQNGYWDEKTIDFKKASYYEENGTPPGEYVAAIPSRYYPAGATASHLLGYVGQISPEEYAHLKERGYRQTDRVGKTGMERQYELKITGTRGRRVVLVNSQGKFINYLAMELPLGHKPFRCTIDARLQAEAYAALREQNRRGAVIFMDSFTGDVIVLASHPSFDDNVTSEGLHSEVWGRLNNDPEHPLLNRAIGIAAPLGSVFKIATAVAALEEGLVKPDTVFHCPGGYRLGRTYFKCWTSHGSIRFVDGIAHSCDVVFYTLGHALGVTRIKKYANMLGLGRKTDIDLPGESIGNVPDPEWKRIFRKSEWYEGDTISYSIGQGYIQISPVQALEMANVLATRGLMVRPRVWAGRAQKIERVKVSERTLDTVRLGMRKAVMAGTAVRLSRFNVPAAGKTGTADDPPRLKPHAWFVGFAPFDKPRLTFAVFVENGGHGASDALPIADRVLKLALKLGFFGDQYNKKQTSPADGEEEQKLINQSHKILD